MKLRNLLIPTDFTDRSLPSLKYALALAKDCGATLHVQHSYYIPINTIETDYIADQALWLEHSRQQALEEMSLLEQQHLQKSGVLYECHIHPGPSMDDINLTIRENAIDLVVIGTHKSDGLYTFFGELYTQAISKAKAPVLLVPEGCSYALPQKAVFASDLKPVDQADPLMNLSGILGKLNPALVLEVLHVHGVGEHPGKEMKEELARLQQHFNAFNPIMVLQEAEDIEDGILSYARHSGADWLVAVSHQYGLLEGVFHSSHTKKLARQTPVPLLVSHE